MAYRIALLYLLSVLALLALLGTGVYLATERGLIGTLQDELQAEADRDAVFLQTMAPAAASLQGTARTLAPALGQGPRSLRIFDANGAVIAGAPELGARPSPPVLRDLPPGFLMLGLRAEAQPDRLYAASPVRDAAGATIAVVEVSQTRGDADRLLARLGQAFGLAGLAAVGLALLAGMGLARSIVAPVRRLERMAAAIAGGDLERRVGGLPRNELGALGTSFNRMAERLAGLLQQARAEQERLAAILGGLADGVLACDRAGAITLENPAAREVLGVAATAPAAALTEACAALGLPALWQRAMEGGAPVEMEISPPGRSVLAVAAPIGGGADGAAGCVCVLHDVTRARESEQGRTAVLRRLGHELRTPLTALQAVVDNLAEVASPEQAPALAVVEEETARLARLVEELLVVARGPLAGTLALRPVDLAAVAAAACALFTTRATRLGVTLTPAPDATPGPPVIVRGDADRLRQVLVNLLDNALRYTPAGGRVTVTVAAESGEAVLTVRDTGAGMDPISARWAFEPYYQGPAPSASEPAPTETPRRSSGLGLAIVREIVAAHGGRLALDSAPGAGTTVTVRLPRLEPAAIG